MAFKKQNTRNFLNASIFVAIFISLFLNPISAMAMGNSVPTFTDFAKAVQNGDKNVLRGVYVSNVMALPVVQQPSGNAGYVSSTDGEATQFRMATHYGNIGLLAHNNLSGRNFSQLAVGQEIRLVYGDGKVEYFVVTEVLRFQALQPNNPYSSFSNLDKKETLTAEQMFKRVYFGSRHVTFQTCIEAEDNQSWGRLFVIAIPKSDYDALVRLNQ